MSALNARLQIGLIATDVAVAKATNERTAIAFNNCHKHQPGSKDAAGKPLPPISLTGTKVYCKECQKELPKGDPDLTKGYEFAKNQLIEVPEGHVKALKVPTSGAIVIAEIVDPTEINKRPFFLTGSYYHLTPPAKAKHADPAYGLILEALKDGSYAIGKTAIYGRTQAVAVTAGQNCLLMYLLRYPEEVRPEPSVQIPPVDQNQLAMCKQILNILKKPEIDLNYVDDFETAKKQLVDQLMAGVMTIPTAPAAPTVVSSNIEEQLKATLAALQGQQEFLEEASERLSQPKDKPVAKKKGGKKARVA